MEAKLLSFILLQQVVYRHSYLKRHGRFFILAMKCPVCGKEITGLDLYALIEHLRRCDCGT